VSSNKAPSHVVLGVLGFALEYHKTPADLYAKLVQRFGEQESSGVRWVSFGAGNVALTFWPADKDGSPATGSPEVA